MTRVMIKVTHSGMNSWVIENQDGQRCTFTGAWIPENSTASSAYFLASGQARSFAASHGWEVVDSFPKKLLYRPTSSPIPTVEVDLAALERMAHDAGWELEYCLGG